MIDKGTHEIALRFDLQLSGHARSALAAVSKRKKPAPFRRQLLTRLSLRRLDTFEEDRRSVAEHERRSESKRPNQIGTLAALRAAMRAGARSVVLLTQQRDTALGRSVDDLPSDLLVEPKAAGGRGRVCREKAILNEIHFLLLCRLLL